MSQKCFIKIRACLPSIQNNDGTRIHNKLMFLKKNFLPNPTSIDQPDRMRIQVLKSDGITDASRSGFVPRPTEREIYETKSGLQ